MFVYPIMGLLIFCLRKSIKLDNSVSIFGLIISFVIHWDCWLKFRLLQSTIVTLLPKNKLASVKIISSKN